MEGKVLSFIANPLKSVPPPVNSANVMANIGYSVLVVGYRDENLPKIQKIGRRAWILRLDMSSRRIPIAFLRRFLVLFELYFAIKKVVKRYEPQTIIAFNEIGSIYLRFIGDTASKKLNWALEYPENFTGSLFENILHSISSKSTHLADAIIFPTDVRKAMACVKNSKILNIPMFVIHNSPILVNNDNRNKNSSQASILAREFLDKNSNSIKVIYAGAVGNRYGWDALIQSVCFTSKEVCLLILGEKHELGEYEYKRATQNCPNLDRVAWIEAVPYNELGELVQMADLGFVSYRGDTLNTFFSAPGKLYEYLKEGLAILTDENACIKTDIELYNCGYILPFGYDFENIMTVFERVDLRQIQVKKKNARKLFEEKYNMQRQMKSLMQWLDHS